MFSKLHSSMPCLHCFAKVQSENPGLLLFCFYVPTVNTYLRRDFVSRTKIHLKPCENQLESDSNN